MNKTKIVCTIGPSSCDDRMLRNLVKSGMNIARLNSSHNSLDWHRRVIKNIRAIDKNIPILLDLPGRKVRTHKHMEPFKFSKGEKLTISSNQDCVDKNKISINYNQLHRDLKAGDTILADDGTLKFKVKSINGQNIVCRALTKGILKSGKGLNFPSVKLNSPFVTKEDQMVIKFAVENGVDWIGISFVENAKHIRKIKKLLGTSEIGIISKIENQFAIDNIDRIIEESSGLMVDRGDLGAETHIEHIGLIQKDIIAKANEYAKPVIIATEILQSMIQNPHPTKAEIVDISNSILDGASAIMLSGETAIGENPIAAVRLMRAVANEVEEKHADYSRLTHSSIKRRSVSTAIGKSINEICKEIHIDKVVCITLSGYAASTISRYRIKPPILAVSNTVERARSFNLFWGVEGVPLNIWFFQHKYDHIIKSIEKLWRIGKLKDSDVVILTAVIFPNEGNKMNSITVHKTRDLKKVFNWKRKN